MANNNNETPSLGLAALARDENKDLSEALATKIIHDSAWKYPKLIDDLRWNQLFPYKVVLLEKSGNGWVVIPSSQFTLPVPPDSLQRTMQTATVTSVTQGGIIEEHNGAPLRPLNISGTTGVFPLRGTGAVTVPTPLFVGCVLGAIVLLMIAGAWWNRNKPPGMGM